MTDPRNLDRSMTPYEMFLCIVLGVMIIGFALLGMLFWWSADDTCIPMMTGHGKTCGSHLGTMG